MRLTVAMKGFYWYFRPLAILAKIFGVFPLQNIFAVNPEKLKHQYFSLSFLYTLVIGGIYVAVMVYFSGLVYQSIIVVKTSIFVILVVYIILGRSFLSFGFSQAHGRKLLRLIRLLDTFDQRKHDYLCIKNINLFTNVVFWTVLPGLVCLSVLAFCFLCYGELIHSVLPTDVEQINGLMVSVCFGFLSVWQTVPIFTFLYFGLKIRSNFDEINDTVRMKKYTGSFLEDIKSLSNLYSQVIFAFYVTAMSYCSGFMLNVKTSIFVLVVVYVILGRSFLSFGFSQTHGKKLIQLIRILDAFDKKKEYILITKHNSVFLNILKWTVLPTIVCLFTLFSGFTNYAQLMHSVLPNILSEFNGYEIVHLFNGIRLSSITPESLLEIRMMMIQLNLCPVEVTAAGFFVLDKSKLASVSKPKQKCCPTNINHALCIQP
ncbi:unnamed protein product [Brassicogethes aeneus]|uniref:Gustatory receptor n=1 Tax=Brassicogethes aeneus TaxID=1431903 RepID=A0A9P0AQ59_BRAAE|nr:unnamed protein product [Brassicogethes aeneus]